MNGSPDLTQFLIDWSEGDESAVDRLFPVVYAELHRLAENYMNRESGAHTLQATALVNEAYLRLIDQTRVSWQNRSHFFAVSAKIMRRILVDYARRNLAEKRGGGVETVSLDEEFIYSKDRSHEVLALDGALKKLGEIDPRRQKVVELRFFGGLKLEEVSDVLGVSVNTILRDWNFAKAWLYRELNPESD